MEKTIKDFLSSEYRDFAYYTIEGRAIPSIVDGFKPVQRKIIHIANQIWKIGSEKPLKVFQLSGKVASDAFYHHGEASLSNAVITMAQSFKNNLPLLDEIGQFGSLRSPAAGAPRYIGTRLTKNFRLVYKDFDLLTYREEEGQEIEPNFFLPIIPMVLVNGSSGIAVGFSSNILNRNPLDIITCCESYLKTGVIKKIIPYNPYFNGDYIEDPENKKRWIIRGKFKRVNTTTINITELPPSMTFEKYENILDSLIDNKTIVSYEDNCKDKIDYTLKFTREYLTNTDDEKIIKVLKLEENETEIFTTLDENGKLKIFENWQEILKYFVDFRLNYYFSRKEFQLNKLKSELKVLQNKGKFIKFILDGKLEIKSRSKIDIIGDMENLELEKIDSSYDYLLRMPLWSLTIELFESLKEDFSKKKSEISELEKMEPKDMYLNDLTELKKKLK